MRGCAVVLLLAALGCANGPVCTACGGTCVNLQSDDRNCGGCGQLCGAGTSCQSGECTPTCASLVCNGACVDSANDPLNCGACGVECQPRHAPGVCVAGQCSHAPCDDGWFDCDFDPTNGCEVSVECRVDACGLLLDGGQHSCFQPVMSGDGRRVTYLSADDEIVPGDVNGAYDVFVYEVDTGHVSSPTASTDGGNAAGDIGSLTISADGTTVAFVCTGALIPEDQNDNLDIYLMDLGTGTLTLAGSNADAGFAVVSSTLAVSSNARYFAASILCDAGVCPAWLDRETGAVRTGPASASAEGVSISGDGQSVGYIDIGAVGERAWLFDVAGDAVHLALDPEDAGLLQVDTPVFSDTAATYFVHTNPGGFEDPDDPFQLGTVWLEGATGPRLLPDGGVQTFVARAQSLSSDGRLMGLLQNEGANFMPTCGVLDLTTGALVPTTPFAQTFGCQVQISRDGHWLLVDQQDGRPFIVPVKPVQ